MGMKGSWSARIPCSQPTSRLRVGKSGDARERSAAESKGVSEKPATFRPAAAFEEWKRSKR